MRSFLAKLSTVGMNNLTSREEAIVEFIKNNSKEIIESNIKIDDLAKKAKTGFSAIYGLLKKLEIDGYRDFMICLANDVEHAELNVSQNDENVSIAYINIIKQNHTLIKKSQIIKTIEYINHAPRVFLCYWEGVLKGPAMDLSNFFFKQNINVHLMDSDWDSINERINTASKDDLFIFMTKYGTSTHLGRIIENIGSKKGKSIFISGKQPSKVVKSNAAVIHTLTVDGMEFEGSGVVISKTLSFHYFNDLLIYHFQNSKTKR